MIEKIKRVGILRNLALIISIVVVILAIYNIRNQIVIIDKMLFPLCWLTICLNWIAEIIDGIRLRKEVNQEILKRIKWERAFLRVKARVRFESQLPEETRDKLFKILDDEFELACKEIDDAIV